MTERVLIAGAGVVGIACAHYLREQGYAVTVVDAGRVGAACSHGNCGYICPSHVLPLTEPGAFKVAFKSLFNPRAPFRVKPQLRPELARWMFEFARRCTRKQMLAAGVHLKAILDASLTEYKALVASGLECEWRERGLLYVLRTAHGMAEFTRTDQLLRDEFGVGAKRIEGRDLPAVDAALKDGLAGAFLYEGDCHLRPETLNRNWSERLRHQGVHFVEHCRVFQIERAADGRVAALTTSEGRMEADHFVFALGAESSRWARSLDCKIPIEPGKGYSVTMRRPANCPAVPMLFPEHKIGVTPFEEGYRIGSMMEFSGYDRSIPPHRIQQLWESATSYLRSSSSLGTSSSLCTSSSLHAQQEEWFGWRPMTWDSLPVIGRVPAIQNAFLCTGHNMLGLSLAPASGKLLAEIVAGRPTHIPRAPYCPSRFSASGTKNV